MDKAFISPEQLILKVKARPLLWDHTHKDYNKKELKRRIWELVTRELVANFAELDHSSRIQRVEKVRMRWKSLRDCYIKEKKTSNKGKRRYMYAELLDFLHPNGNRRRRTIIKEERPKPVRVLKVTKKHEAKEDTTKIDAETEREPKPMEINAFSLAPTVDNSINQSTSTISNNGVSEEIIKLFSNREWEDEDKAFFISLLPTVRLLNTDQKLWFRSEVLQTLMNIKTSSRSTDDLKII